MLAFDGIVSDALKLEELACVCCEWCVCACAWEWVCVYVLCIVMCIPILLMCYLTFSCIWARREEEVEWCNPRSSSLVRWLHERSFYAAGHSSIFCVILKHFSTTRLFKSSYRNTLSLELLWRPPAKKPFKDPLKGWKGFAWQILGSRHMLTFFLLDFLAKTSRFVVNLGFFQNAFQCLHSMFKVMWTDVTYVEMLYDVREPSVTKLVSNQSRLRLREFNVDSIAGLSMLISAYWCELGWTCELHANTDEYSYVELYRIMSIRFVECPHAKRCRASCWWMHMDAQT